MKEEIGSKRKKIAKENKAKVEEKKKDVVELPEKVRLQVGYNLGERI